MPFVLETDASASGIGAVLMQQGRAIAFYSQSLGPKVSAQSTYYKEALAILQALRKWRHYILGNRLIIKTDQQSLKYMMNQRLVEGIQHKLLMKLMEFDYVIEYKKGKENKVVDALSRKDNCLMAIISAVPTWISDVEASYVNDSHYTELIQKLSVQPQTAPQYSLHSGILRYRGKICIGNGSELKKKILSSLHSSTIGGHSGIRATYQRVHRIFHWYHMKKEVEQFVTECAICQRAKAKHSQYPGLLAPLPIPTMVWTCISMVFVEGLPKSGSKDVILVVVDRLSKYSHYIALSHPYSVNTVAQLFMDNVFKLHGPPIAILTDIDRIFTSNLCQSMFKSIKIILHYCSAYHPQSDGQTERVN
jgi:hypothetical protein